MEKTEIELGKKYQDRATGVTGVATGYCRYLHDTDTVCLEWQGDDTKGNSQWFSIYRLQEVAQ